MRIATAHAFDSAVESLTRQKTELADSQSRLSSLKRVNRASDDPTAAARIERSLASTQRIEANQRAVDASRHAMTQSESALGAAVELLQQARDILVASGNGTYGDAERKHLGQELRGLRQQLLGIANRDDGSGRALFGGQGAAATPFSERSGGVAYSGAGGESSADGDGALPMTLDGAAVWLQAPTGNGVFETRSAAASGGAWIDAGHVSDPALLTGGSYSVRFDVTPSGTTYSVSKDGAPTAQTDQPYVSGRAIEVDGMSFAIRGNPANGDLFDVVPSTRSLSVFDALDRIAGELQTPSRSGGAIAQTTASGLRDLDSVLGRVSEARTRAGTVLQRIDGAGSQLASESLSAQSDRAEAQDLDMVAAISDFQNRQSGMEAALKSYAMVQRMSLFQYLNG